VVASDAAVFADAKANQAMAAFVSGGSAVWLSSRNGVIGGLQLITSGRIRQPGKATPIMARPAFIRDITLACGIFRLSTGSQSQPCIVGALRLG